MTALSVFAFCVFQFENVRKLQLRDRFLIMLINECAKPKIFS